VNKPKLLKILDTYIAEQPLADGSVEYAAVVERKFIFFREGELMRVYRRGSGRWVMDTCEIFPVGNVWHKDKSVVKEAIDNYISSIKEENAERILQWERRHEGKRKFVKYP
jgi:hypothetical protein